MHHTALHFGFGVDALDGLPKAFKVVNTGNQDVFEAPVVQVGKYAQPKVSPFTLGDIGAEYLLVPVRVDAQNIVEGFVLHASLAADFVVHRIEPHNTVYRLDRKSTR